MALGALRPDAVLRTRLLAIHASRGWAARVSSCGLQVPCGPAESTHQSTDLAVSRPAYQHAILGGFPALGTTVPSRHPPARPWPRLRTLLRWTTALTCERRARNGRCAAGAAFLSSPTALRCPARRTATSPGTAKGTDSPPNAVLRRRRPVVVHPRGEPAPRHAATPPPTSPPRRPRTTPLAGRRTRNCTWAPTAKASGGASGRGWDGNGTIHRAPVAMGPRGGGGGIGGLWGLSASETVGAVADR